MSEPKILVFAGSVRPGSLNETLAAYVARQLRALGAEVDHVSLRDYPMPLYDAELEQREGVPAAAVAFGQLIAAHQGVFIATPEYNAGMTPLLKNTIDWVSRPDISVFRNRIFALGAASNGQRGGYRSLIHCRHVLELGVTALVQPQMISVAGASKVYDENGDITDAGIVKVAQGATAALYANARRFA